MNKIKMAKYQKTVSALNHQLRRGNYEYTPPQSPVGPRAVDGVDVLICEMCGQYFHTEDQWHSKRKRCQTCAPGSDAHTPDVTEYLTTYLDRRLKAGFEFLRRSGSFDE